MGLYAGVQFDEHLKLRSVEHGDLVGIDRTVKRCAVQMGHNFAQVGREI